MENLIPHLLWAGVLGVWGVVALVRSTRAFFGKDAAKGQSGVWVSLLLLYLAVGLLVWGLVVAVTDSRAEEKRLEESLLRLSQENSKLSERLRALENK
jgi:hypothetical protein